MKGIVYKTTCLLNKKIYIGQHWLKDEENFDPWYMGSGSELKKWFDIAKKIEKNWTKYFSREILKVCYNQNQMNGYELYYIKKFDSCNPSIGMNILKSCCFKNAGASRDKRVAIKISLSLKGRKLSDETRLKMSMSQKGKRLGIKMSQDTKQKLREKHLGRKLSEETKKKLSEIRRGKKHTKSWNDKISRSQSGEKCKFTNTIWIYNYIERVNKRIPVNAEIPIGWKKGRLSYFD